MMANNVILGFPTPKINNYKVYVRSITYNQAPYIVDCLNGVAMQQTDFPFVHHVIDDRSTDGEQEVIKTYLNNNCDMDNAEYYDNDICSITIAKNKSNPNCNLVVYFLKKNMYGKPEKQELYRPWREVCLYEALCEGDDYWIDAQKLQEQINILDNDNNCVMVYTSFKVVDEKNNEVQIPFWNHIKKYSHSGDNFPTLMKLTYIMTLTICIRTSVFKSDLFKKCPVNIDNALFKIAALLGKFEYIPQCTSAYRRNSNGITMSSFDTMLEKTEIGEYYLTKRYLAEYKYQYGICTRIKNLMSIANTISRIKFSNPYLRIFDYSKYDYFIILITPYVFLIRTFRKINYLRKKY